MKPWWWMRVEKWEAFSVIKKYGLEAHFHEVAKCTIWCRPSSPWRPVIRQLEDSSWEANMDVPEWASPPEK